MLFRSICPCCSKVKFVQSSNRTLTSVPCSMRYETFLLEESLALFSRYDQRYNVEFTVFSVSKNGHLGYRPGFINVLKCLDDARKCRFGYSLYYLKYEEPLLRYILSSAKAYKEGCFAPFPCLFYDEQLPRAGRKLPDLNDELSDTPHINHLKRWLENRSLRAEDLGLLSDEKVNQLLWFNNSTKQRGCIWK